MRSKNLSALTAPVGTRLARLRVVAIMAFEDMVQGDAMLMAKIKLLGGNSVDYATGVIDKMTDLQLAQYVRTVIESDDIHHDVADHVRGTFEVLEPGDYEDN